MEELKLSLLVTKYKQLKVLLNSSLGYLLFDDEQMKINEEEIQL